MTEATGKSALQSRVTSGVAAMHKWSRVWSLVHHALLFGAALLSACAATVLQLPWFEEQNKKGTASVLSACAAVAGVIAASGAFERKWRTCRVTRGRLFALEIDLTDDKVDLDRAREQYKAIWEAHEPGITGMPAGPVTPLAGKHAELGATDTGRR